MAWVRTAAAMIGFGFTIFQFFDRFNQMQSVAPPRHPMAPRMISLALIGIGTFALIAAIIEYYGEVHYLWAEEYKDIAGIRDKPSWTPAGLAAFLLAIVGIVTFG
jgi:putative membrane protein